MSRRPGYSPEVRERAVRMVLTGELELTSRWAAVQSAASKIGCTPQTVVMLDFIDTHRKADGVEPICKVLPIAPSTAARNWKHLLNNAAQGQNGMRC